MGLVKTVLGKIANTAGGVVGAGVGSLGGVLADQWKEYFYCDAISDNILSVRGQKRTTDRSVNTKGLDNIISNGSVISVADKQCMIIVDQGKVTEICAEPGEFVYDTSTEPSIFAGSLGSSILDTFKNIGKRFTFGGEAPKDQRVYYINLREIKDNKFGTPNPVPFRVVINEQLGYKLTVDLRMNGTYSYEIFDPILFYTNVCGNSADDYHRSNIDGMLKGELIQSLQPALAQLSAASISYDQIGGHVKELSAALNEELKDSWGKRGIRVYSMNISVPSIPEDQRKKISEWEENVMTMNPNVAAARLVGAQADAMKTAAGNSNGAMAGFMGMGMAMNAGGMNAQNLFAMGAQQQAQQAQPAAQQPTQPAPADSWTCKKPAVDDCWTCSCGAVNKGKFCQNCGAKKPEGAPLYRCDKCGWEPEDPKNPPKFCPECGDRFDNNDIK